MYLGVENKNVKAVLGLLDDCGDCVLHDVTDHNGDNPQRVQLSGCNRCHGAGKALHVDRVVGALRRWAQREQQLINLMDDVTAECGEYAWPDAGSVNEALAYCRAARAILEAA